MEISLNRMKTIDRDRSTTNWQLAFPRRQLKRDLVIISWHPLTDLSKGRGSFPPLAATFDEPSHLVT